MKGRSSTTVVGAFVAALALLATGAATAHPGQHGPLAGHLVTPQLPAGMTQDQFGAWGKVEFVGQVTVHDAEADLIADVAVDPDHDYAYLARWGGEACGAPEGGGKDTPDGGVYIIDIRNPENPVEVGFIATHQDTLVGEGMQVVRIDTAKFTGDVLLMNHEQCGKNGKAGVSLWDVTDPTKPKKLSEHFGDFTVDGDRNAPHDANQTHSAFMWDAGARAYLVAVDDDEAADVDIFDITDPKHPKLITELDLHELGLEQPELGLDEVFFHDVVVKNIGGRWIMLLSYWDGGWVLMDVTNPANPVLLGDTDYPATDPLVTGVAPEGNAHQAEFTQIGGNWYFVGTDEDFAPYRLTVTTAEGDTFRAKPGTQTTNAEAEGVSGTPVFVGRACPGDAAVPAPPAGVTDPIAVVERGLCTFEEKALAVKAAGYDSMIIFNREGSDACAAVFEPSLDAEIPTIFIGRDAGFDLFDVAFDPVACEDATQQRAPIALGAVGDVVTAVDATFDGWGYVRLYGFTIAGNTASFQLLDNYAIPEALDPNFASDFGDLSVHEVAIDPLDPTLAYLSYYSGGIRAVQIQCSGVNACQLVEVGGFIDSSTTQPDGPAGPLVGNDFWGIEAYPGGDCDDDPEPDTLILGSDMDSGLWIFCDP